MSCAKDDPVEIKVGKIGVGWGRCDWKERFVTNMGSTTGVDGLRRKYIIREIKPQVWVSARDSKTYEEKLIYLVPVHGTVLTQITKMCGTKSRTAE